jgi:hypothetical protein
MMVIMNFAQTSSELDVTEGSAHKPNFRNESVKHPRKQKRHPFEVPLGVKREGTIA